MTQVGDVDGDGINDFVFNRSSMSNCTLGLTVTDDAGCMAMADEINFDVIAAPVVEAFVEMDMPELICAGQTTRLDSDVSGGMMPYESSTWDVARGSDAACGTFMMPSPPTMEPNPTVAPPMDTEFAGSCTYVLTVTDGAECVGSDTVTVAISPSPEITTPVEDVEIPASEGASVTLTVEANNADRFQWQYDPDGNGFIDLTTADPVLVSDPEVTSMTTLTIPNIRNETAGGVYRCQVIGTCDDEGDDSDDVFSSTFSINLDEITCPRDVDEPMVTAPQDACCESSGNMGEIRVEAMFLGDGDLADLRYEWQKFDMTRGDFVCIRPLDECDTDACTEVACGGSGACDGPLCSFDDDCLVVENIDPRSFCTDTLMFVADACQTPGIYRNQVTNISGAGCTVYSPSIVVGVSGNCLMTGMSVACPDGVTVECTGALP